MTQKTLDRLRKLYQSGDMKKAQIDAMLEAGKITEEEYYYIVGYESQ